RGTQVNITRILLGWIKERSAFSVVLLLCASVFLSCDDRKIEIPKQTAEEEALEKQKTTLTLRSYEGRQFFVSFNDFGKGVGVSASFAHLRRDCSFRKDWVKGERNPLEGVLTA